MGRKRTPVFRKAEDVGPINRNAAKIKAINTWDDVEHDSEDECNIE